MQMSITLGRPWVRLVLIVWVGLFTATSAWAGGSVDLTNNGGHRPFLQWNAGTSGGLPRQTYIHVFANAGEELNFGSSTHTSYTDPQDIVFSYWDGAATVTSSCDVIEGGLGHIENRAEELAGPQTAASPGGFEPCTFIAPVTGIYQFEFHAPFFDVGSNNPPATLADADFPTDGSTRRTVAAWDVTVHASPAPDAAAIDGRVYTNLLVLDLGNNGLSMNSIIYVLTFDGYVYRINMNGIDPFAVSILANTKGLRDAATGNAIYQSVQMVGGNPGGVETAQSGIDIKNPLQTDNPATYDHTHKIFFRQPAADLPASAVMADGQMTWLQSPPAPPPTIRDFRFVGAEGTPGQMDPTLGGTFLFESDSTGSYNINVDINANGDYTEPIDRNFTGNTVIGTNTIIWDGRDGLGNFINATGEFAVNVRTLTYAGEIHFPFSDPENNRRGLIIERIVGPPPGTTIPEPDPDIVYYNDTYTYDGTNAYNYSLCAAGEAPNPPDLAIPITDPRCYGNPPVPRDAREGVNSAPNGAHAWTALFGDRRIMDTWTYFPSTALLSLELIQVAAADLAIVKDVVPDRTSPGGSVVFTITVVNKGPDNVQGALVTDGLPPEFININWTCTVTGIGTCSASGTGNIADTVDLNAGPTQNFLTYTITADIDPATPLGSLVNIARVDPPADVHDPTPEDNQDPATVLIVDDPPPPDTATPIPTTTPIGTVTPEVTPTPFGTTTPLSTPDPNSTPTAIITRTPAPFDPNQPNVRKDAAPPVAAPGDEVIWTITVTNPLGTPITGVTATDTMPAVLEIISAEATAGTVNINGQTVQLQADVIESGEVITVTIRTRIRADAGAGIVENLVILDYPGGDDPTPEDTETLIVAGGLPNTGEPSPLRAALPATLLIISGLSLLFAGIWSRARRTY